MKTIYFLKDFKFFYAGYNYNVTGGKADGSVELILAKQAVKEFRGDIKIEGSQNIQYFNHIQPTFDQDPNGYREAQYLFFKNTLFTEIGLDIFQHLIAEGVLAIVKPVVQTITKEEEEIASIEKEIEAKKKNK